MSQPAQVPPAQPLAQQEVPTDALGRTITGTSAALLAVAAAHQIAQNALIANTLKAVQSVWFGVPFRDFSGGWRTAGPRIYGYISAAQELAASQSASYIQQAFAVQGISVELPPVNPRNFAGATADSLDMERLLVGTVVAAKRKMERGGDMHDAYAAGEAYLKSVARTEIADAGTAADQVALIAVQRTEASPLEKPPASGTVVTDTGAKKRYGWVRMLNPPSCARCAVLAGRFYKWNDGFERHINCWTAGTIVSGSEFLASARRWYEGELVTIRTESGQELSITANHPVLTTRGWIPAKFVNEGDNVLRSIETQGATPLVIPDAKEVPSRIEDVFDSLGSMRLRGVPTSPEDFHGDGGYGEVDVVLADRLLGNGFYPEFAEQIEEAHFPLAVHPAVRFIGHGTTKERFFVNLASTASVMRSLGLEPAFLGSHARRADLPRRRATAWLDSVIGENFPDLTPGDAQAFANAVFGVPGVVAVSDEVGFYDDAWTLPRWDPTSDSESMQDSAADARRGLDLVQRLAGQVHLDRVVSARRVDWSGHVYSLTTAEGWVSSNNLITSNCDCRHIPVEEQVAGDLTTDPQAYFNSLSIADQEKYFGVANSAAIAAGADLNQVVNAAMRRGGVYTVGGRRYTREGVTRRGYYGTREAGRARQRRPTPYQIMKDARGDQAAAVRLLKQFGYVI